MLLQHKPARAYCSVSCAAIPNAYLSWQNSESIWHRIYKKPFSLGAQRSFQHTQRAALRAMTIRGVTVNRQAYHLCIILREFETFKQFGITKRTKGVTTPSKHARFRFLTYAYINKESLCIRHIYDSRRVLTERR